MRSTPHRRVASLLALPRRAKKTLAILTDASLCVLTVWLAICFRFESWVSLAGYQWLAVLLSVLLAIPLLSAFGFYHTVIRFVGKQTITAALRAMGLYAVIYMAVFTAYGFPLVPRAIGVLQPLLLLIGLALVRIFASQLLSSSSHEAALGLEQEPVLIYGAGRSGQQLAASLASAGHAKVVGFLDDNPNLHKASISGIVVHPAAQVQALVQRHEVRQILLAMPSLSRSRRNEILQLLSSTQVAVRTLPSLSDLASGKANSNDLRAINIEDLLGRDPVAAQIDLLRKNIAGKVVVVTGAGGSIGSELARQILQLQPARLVLLELNEFALYAIHEELSGHIASWAVDPRPVLTPVLANVLEAEQIRQLFLQIKPHTIYHAAAYKHVPLVESNPVAGLKNNVLGTLHVAQAALAAGADDMVLVSTDKAVRPTNVMGASKRLAEMTLQSLAAAHAQAARSTRFCTVRFGNVLGSSGSVIPKFQQQIQAGGPVSLTHPEITRYFMTIPEAAQLVIQAAALNENHQSGAQVFLLDMGESVKIAHLAKTLIQLSGLSVRDASHPSGDIAIEITGLRPGEKLYEELLIEGNPQHTSHPKIWLSQDSQTQAADHTAWTDWIAQASDLLSHAQITQQLIALNTGYQRPSHAA
ncbi:MAG: polysaccharide biosynthesis protein [Brachymonas sp.]